jgi:5-methylcytosine-specific restriction endonuclease McrA
MQRITRKAAKAVGLKYYFTGKPCKRGHIEQRFVSTRICLQCNRQASRQWAKGSHAREKRRESQRDRRRVAREAGRKYYFTGKPCKRGHIDKRLVASFGCMTCLRENALKHFRNLEPTKREARRDYERRRWQDPAFRKQMLKYRQRPDELEKQRVRNRAWKKANRVSCSDRELKRHASFLTAFVEDVSLEFLFARDKGRCQLCGYELSMDTKRPDPRTPTRDHIIPLSKGGTHERKNMQLACDVCNVRKSNRVVQ